MDFPEMKGSIDKKHNNDVIAIFLSMSVTLGIIVLAIFSLGFIPESLDINFINVNYVLSHSAFKPEKHELLQYVISTLLFPFLFCVFFKLFSKTINKKIEQRTRVIEFLQFFITFGFAIFAVLILPQNLIQNIFSLYLLFFVFALYFFQTIKGIGKTIFSILFTFIGCSAVVFISWLYITYNYFINDRNIWHVDAYYYPVFEVFNGKTLTIDFNSLYGFYPYILAPILRLFNEKITMFNFSILMSILVFVVFGGILFVLWKNLKNKVIMIIGFFAILFNANPFYVSNNGYYLQYTPHRMIGPVLILLVFQFFISSKSEKSKKIIYYLGFMVGSFSLFWNIDTGVIVILAWALVQIYFEAIKYKLNDKKIYLKAFRIIGMSILSVLTSYLVLLLITYFRSGNIISIYDAISGQILFLGTGFFMLPMTFPHKWVLLIMVYIIGLSKSLPKLSFMSSFENDPSTKTHYVYFMLSILGLGLFSYYQGRSHDEVFPTVIWPGIILASLFAEEYFNNIVDYYKNSKKNIFSLAVIGNLVQGILVIVILSLFSISFIDQTINKTLISRYINNTSYPLPANVTNKIDFIRQNSKDIEKVDILTQYFEEFYTMLGVKNPTNIRSLIDAFTREDYNNIFKRIETTTNQIYLDKYFADLLILNDKTRLEKVLNERFDYVASIENLAFYKLK